MLTKWKHQIETVRARAQILCLWGGIAWGVSAAAAVAAAACLCAGPLPSQGLRIALLGVAPVLGLLLFCLKGVAPARRMSPARVAALIERNYGQVGGRVISAVELERDLAESPVEGRRFSTELARAFLDTVDRDLPDVDAAVIYPATPFARAVLCMSGLLALCLAALIARPDALDIIFASPKASTPAPVRPALSARSVTIQYEYPAYSRLEERTVTNAGGAISALKGTQITLTVELASSVKSASIVLPARETTPGSAGVPPADPAAPMALENGRVARTSFTLTDAGKYRIDAVTPKGESVSLPEYDMVVEPDHPPAVTIVRAEPAVGPDRAIEVDQNGAVEIWFNATDDFGLGEARLAVAPRPEDKPDHVARTHLEGARDDKALRWKIEPRFAKSAEPVFYLWVEVDDNDAVSGPKTTRSAPILVRLITPEARHDQTIALQKLLLEQMVQLLGDYLELRPKPAIGQFVSVQRTVTTRLANVIQLGLLCAGRLKEDTLADYNVLKVINEMTDRRRGELERRTDVVAHASGLRSGSLPAAFMDSWEKAHALDVSALEADVLLLDNYIKAQEMAAIASVGKRIAESRKRLERLQEQLKSKGLDDKLRAEIEKEIKALQQQIAEMMTRMSRLAQNMPSEHLNPDALASGKSREAQSLMEQMRKAMDEGRTEDALRLAAELSKMLEESLNSMQKQMEAWASNSFGKDLQKIRDLQKTLSELQREQNQIVSETAGLRDKHQKQAMESQADAIDKAISDLRKQVQSADRLTEKLDAASKPPERPPAFDFAGQTKGLDELRKDWQKLDKQLEKREIFESSQTAKDCHSTAVRRIQDHMRREMMTRQQDPRTEPKAPPEDALRLEKQAREIARGIDDLMRNLQQSADNSASAREGGAMSDLARKQGAAQKQAEQMQKELSELSGDGQPAGDAMQRAVGKASDWMKMAERQLDRKQLSEGLGAEKEALEALSEADREAREQLQRMGDASRLRQMQMPSLPDHGPEGGSMGTARGRVDIPDANAFKPSARFREEIMRIISNGLPEPYQKANEEYYRRLVE